MKRTLTLVLLLLLAAESAGQAPARIEQRSGNALLTVTVDQVDPPTVRLTTLVGVTLAINETGPLEVQEQEPLGPADSWKVFRKEMPRALLNGEGWQQRLVLLAKQAKEVTFIPPVLRYRKGDGEWIVVAWKPIHFRVLTHIAKLEDVTPRDITAIEGVPVITARGDWRMWLVIPAVLIAPAFLALVFLFRRKPPVIPVPPLIRARRNLARLARVQPGTPRRYQRANYLLARVLRRYVQAQWGVPALLLTTPELLARTESAKLWPIEQHAVLVDLLTQCDLAKYCPTHPDAAAFAAQVKRARAFLEAHSAEGRDTVQPSK